MGHNMIAYILLAFIVGGMVGMIAMAMLACGPKLLLMRENTTLRQKLQVMEPATFRSRRTIHVTEPEAVYQDINR
jgi:hypothetical protein